MGVTVKHLSSSQDVSQEEIQNLLQQWSGVADLWSATASRLAETTTESLRQLGAASSAMLAAKLQEILRLQISFSDESFNRYFADLLSASLHQPERRDVLEHPETELLLPEVRERIVIYAPAVQLLEQLRAKQISLHDLQWRQFEEIVAELLDQDGYHVQLGRGSKDNGVDIIAMKADPIHGEFMSIWQAKKHERHNKVEVGVIRELAYTRDQLKATKGVIVTTTSLTRGAIALIEQEHHLLHKVDGDDLLAWIQKTRRQK